MTNFLLKLALCAATFVYVAASQADVRLPHVLSSNMVLQQGKPIAFWGWADPGESVTVQIADASQTTVAAGAGRWRVMLPAMMANHTPQSITITGRNRIVLENVLVGEVWLCAGQSNMEMGISHVEHAEKEIAEAKFPEIRLYVMPNQIGAVPQDDAESQWKICSPETVASGGRWGGFSAAGYFFGRTIHRSLNVPVGLIHAAWGATEIESWTAPEGFADVPELESVYHNVMRTDPRGAEYARHADGLMAKTEKWLVDARDARQKHLPLPQMPEMPSELLPLRSEHQPTSLYNGMIHPLVPLSMRGMIWYQGEANHNDGLRYAEKTKALVGGWRKKFEQPDLAFYYTQIAPWNYGNDDPEVLPAFWEAQAAAMSIPNTGMIVTTDLGDMADIHPKKKQEIGRRLALWALAKTYGQERVIYSGPIFKSLIADGRRLRIRFEHTCGKLVSRDGKPLASFEIMDVRHGGFVPAQASTDGDSVLVSALGVDQPVAVRFAWSKNAQPNLINSAGLPAMPFRAQIADDGNALTKIIPEIAEYRLVYDIDLNHMGRDIRYDIDNSAKIQDRFDRIAYLLEITDMRNKNKYMYVSMSSFTKDIRKIGIPAAASGSQFQQKISNMNIQSNAGNIICGNGFPGGYIEFWPNNYGPANAAGIPGASGEQFDFGDQIDSGITDGYGCMQIHNILTYQTLFSLNNWKSGPDADMGIGNAPAGNPDWTFSANAKTYPTKRLRIFVRTVTP